MLFVPKLDHNALRMLTSGLFQKWSIVQNAHRFADLHFVFHVSRHDFFWWWRLDLLPTCITERLIDRSPAYFSHWITISRSPNGRATQNHTESAPCKRSFTPWYTGVRRLNNCIWCNHFIQKSWKSLHSSLSKSFPDISCCLCSCHITA